MSLSTGKTKAHTVADDFIETQPPGHRYHCNGDDTVRHTQDPGCMRSSRSSTHVARLLRDRYSSPAEEAGICWGSEGTVRRTEPS